MDAINYSQDLAKARTNYDKATTELRQSYQKDVKNLKDTHEAIREKQKDNYVESKLNLEKRNADFVDDTNSKIKDVIQSRTKDYQKGIERERFSFNEDRSRLKENFERRLNNLSETYEKRDRDSQAYTDHKIDNLSKRYQNHLDKSADQFNKDVDKVVYNSNNAMRRHQIDANKDKSKLILQNQEQVRDIVKEGSLAKAKTQAINQDNLNKIREAQASQVSQMRDYFNTSAEDLRKGKNKENEKLQETFRDLTSNLSNNAARKRKVEIRANQQQKEALDKDYAKRLYQARREMNEKLKGGDPEVEFNKKMNRSVASYENRLKNLYGKMDEDNFNQSVDKERMAGDFSEAIRNIKHKTAKIIDGKEEEVRDFREGELSSLSTKSDKAISEYKTQLRKSELDAEAQSIKDRQYSKKLLNNQRQAFGETVNKLNEKTQESITEIQEAHTKDKTAFIEKTKKEHYKDMEELKMEHRRILGNKEKSLVERNEQLLDNKEKMAQMYEAKLDRFEKKAHKEMQRITQLHEEQRVEQNLSTRRAIASAERENEAEKVMIKTAYEKRIKNVKDTADKQVEKTVEYYEDMIARERDESKRKLQSKMGEARAEYEKLYQQSQLEKATLQQQFDGRIDELKKANQAQLEEKAEGYKSKMFKKS